MKGLWSEFFPSAADKPTTATSADISPPRRQGQPHLLCPRCNAVACRPITSNTFRNPGRQFYSHDDCYFFKWADELKVKPNQFIYDVPNCGGCGAGECRVLKETFGPDAGRIMFICRVKEGEGSCGYRVWQDELEISRKAPEDDRISLSQTMINWNDVSATNADFVEESKQIDERADDLTSMINTSENHQHQEGISQKIGQFKCQEDQPIESLRRPCKRSRCGDVKASGSLISALSLEVHALHKLTMSRSISNAFCQDDLVTLLETMDVKDHEAVRHAAETTFAALGHLHFDHQDFKNRVMEHIHYASLLSEIEQSMLTNDTHQKLVKLCSSERAILEEMNRVHAGGNRHCDLHQESPKSSARGNIFHQGLAFPN